jgi:hypothetical protein
VSTKPGDLHFVPVDWVGRFSVTVPGMRSNLYQLLEGVAIAAYATGATAAYVAVKKAFQQEARGLEGCDSVFKVFCHPHPSASFRPSDWWRRLWRTWQAVERKVAGLGRIGFRVNFGRRESRSDEGA